MRCRKVGFGEIGVGEKAEIVGVEMFGEHGVTCAVGPLAFDFCST